MDFCSFSVKVRSDFVIANAPQVPVVQTCIPKNLGIHVREYSFDRVHCRWAFGPDRCIAVQTWIFANAHLADFYENELVIGY